jgi:hypothetical protein
MLKFCEWAAMTASLTEGIASVDFSRRVHEASEAAVTVPAPATAAVRRKFLRFVFMDTGWFVVVICMQYTNFPVYNITIKVSWQATFTTPGN